MQVVGIQVCKVLELGSILAGSIQVVDMGMVVGSRLVLGSRLVYMVVDSKDHDRSSSLLA
jgi:hypothetical protein